MATFEQARAHCDIDERLQHVRDDQQVRGVWFSMLRGELARRGDHVLQAYVDELGEHEGVTFRLYPAADYLRRLVVAGALIASAEKVHEGMLALHRASVRHYAHSILGRVVVALVRPTPIGVLREVERRRSSVASYGRVTVEALTLRSVAVHFTDEIVFVESAQRGGVLSVFDVCGIEAETSVEMRTMVDGTIIARW